VLSRHARAAIVTGVSLLSELLAVIAPPTCAACAAPLERAAPLLCAACSRALRWLGPRVCRRCGLPTHRGRACPAAHAAFDSAWAPLAYEDTARDLIRALKFRGALPLASLMASQMAANAPPWAIGRGGVIVPVPPARARLRRRGFDPAAELARELGERLGLPVEPCLRRRGAAPRQMGARRATRRAPGRVQVELLDAPPPTALLLDDVHTTGATLDACSRALRSGGARRIHAVTYGRTL
jgi:ComF family protein